MAESREGHVLSNHHSNLPPNLIPVAGPLICTGQYSLRTSFQACCCVNRYLCHGLGCHVQWTCCIKLLDGPRLQWHVNCLELLAVQLALYHFRALLKGSPYGQHCGPSINQPSWWSTLLPHVTTPFMESGASEVPLCHSHPRQAQLCSQQAFMTVVLPQGKEIPSPVSSADLRMLRRCSGRPVYLSKKLTLPVVFLPD